MLNSIEPWRQQLQQGTLSSQDLLARYSDLVDQLIGLIRRMMPVPCARGEVPRALCAYIRLTQAKELAGLERALGAAGFSARRRQIGDVARLLELAERQRLWLEEYRLQASANMVRLLDAGWTMQDAARLSAMRQMALTDHDALEPTIAVQWFELTSKRIDHLHEVELQLTRNVMQQAEHAEHSAIRAAVWGSLLALGAMLATLLGARSLAQDIIVPLKRVTRGMRRLAQGDQELEFAPNQRADEIGDMMRALAIFRSNLAEIVQAQAQTRNQETLRQKEQRQAEQSLQVARDRYRALARRMQTVREEESTRIAREIHDVLAQELTRLKIDLVWVVQHLDKPRDGAQRALLKGRVSDAIAQTDTAMTAVQDIATSLRPVILDSLGLFAAVEWQVEDFARRTGLSCHTIVPETGRPPDRERSTALFRILQECLTNIARHAKASEVDVRLNMDGDALVLSVHDNGVGMDRRLADHGGPGRNRRSVSDDGGAKKSQRGGDMHSIGLLGMDERALAFGGSIEIDSLPGAGTTVTARLPLEPTT